MEIEKTFELENKDRICVRIFEDDISLFILDNSFSKKDWISYPLGKETKKIIGFINKHFPKTKKSSNSRKITDKKPMTR